MGPGRPGRGRAVIAFRHRGATQEPAETHYCRQRGKGGGLERARVRRDKARSHETRNGDSHAS